MRPCLMLLLLCATSQFAVAASLYQLTDNKRAANAQGAVTRFDPVAGEMHIPGDLHNNDWQDYLNWLKAGNTPDPAPIVIPVYTAQLWQLQAVMSDPAWNGPTWQQVTSAVAALNNSTINAFFEHGTNSIPSNSTTLLALGKSLGMTPEQIVALVQQASQTRIP